MDSILVTTPALRLPAAPPKTTVGSESNDLLRQLLEVQREQAALLRAQLANQDDKARWRNFFNRYADEFTALPQACQAVLPKLERAYLNLLNDLSERLDEADADDADDLDNEFALNEFLDRYGVRLSQLGNIIGQVGHLANIAPNPEQS